MKNFKPSRQNFFSAFTWHLCTGYFFCGALFSPLRSQESQEYKPEFQKIAYRADIPTSIRRAAKKARQTRFFGSFRQGTGRFAVHFYDQSRVRVHKGKFERDSRLDVFQFTERKTWRQIHTFALTRQTDARRDQLTIEAQSLWLDPDPKTIPLIYLKVMENEDRQSSPTGARTDIYGVLLVQAGSQPFKVFNSYIPYSMTTVYLSEISHPDATGCLTLLEIVSNPGDTSCTAYAWAGDKWKVMATVTFENNYESARQWNGVQFVPLAKP